MSKAKKGLLLDKADILKQPILSFCTDKYGHTSLDQKYLISKKMMKNQNFMNMYLLEYSKKYDLLKQTLQKKCFFLKGVNCMIYILYGIDVRKYNEILTKFS